VQVTSAVLAATEGDDDGGWWSTEAAYPIIPHPAEIIVGLIAFAVLYWVIKTKVVPRFEEAFRARTEAIQGGMERAESAQREAQEALEQYRSQLAEARHEAARLREEAREQAAAIGVEIRTKAAEDAERIIRTAREQIESDRQTAFLQLRGQIGSLATDLAGRIVGESLEDEARQRRVVDRFLAELDGASGAGSAPGELAGRER
jgi:F-type H+-transporting ATPase subunit b